MAHAEGKITINIPAQAVFDFILDGANNMLWRPAVTDIKPLVEKPYGVGSEFKQGFKGPGGTQRHSLTVAVFRPWRDLAGSAAPDLPGRRQG